MIYSVKIDFKGVNGAKTEKLIFFGTFWSEFGHLMDGLGA